MGETRISLWQQKSKTELKNILKNNDVLILKRKFDVENPLQ
jgi:hypothetical protein